MVDFLNGNKEVGNIIKIQHEFSRKKVFTSEDLKIAIQYKLYNEIKRVIDFDKSLIKKYETVDFLDSESELYNIISEIKIIMLFVDNFETYLYDDTLMFLSLYYSNKKLKRQTPPHNQTKRYIDGKFLNCMTKCYDYDTWEYFLNHFSVFEYNLSATIHKLGMRNMSLDLFRLFHQHEAIDIKKYNLDYKKRFLYRAMVNEKLDIMEYLIGYGVRVEEEIKNYVKKRKGILWCFDEETLFKIRSMILIPDYKNRLSFLVLAMRDVLGFNFPNQLINNTLLCMNDKPEKRVKL